MDAADPVGAEALDPETGCSAPNAAFMTSPRSETFDSHPLPSMPQKSSPKVRVARTADTEALIALWQRSVSATHQFLAPGELEALAPLVRSQVLGRLEVWVLEQQGRAVGFMALDGAMVEALFLDPTYFRQGGGRQLLAHARALKGALRVDVNEQNVDAIRFYLAAGFEIAGRSDVDQAGRPYPLLHLQEGSAVSFEAKA